uniref:Uncharacterized protein n=1 Tax=Echinococcus canadensis TaxID=519352 RepID=A0A915EZ33_9CEST
MLSCRLINVRRYLQHVLGEKTVPEIRRAAFDFEHSFSCPQEVLVNETFKCSLAVRGANTVQATVQWEDRPPYNQEFAGSIKIKRWFACASEANRVSLGVPSLRDYENVGSTCKLPAQLIYGPITSHRAALHTVWFMSHNGSIRLTHRHLKCHTGYLSDYEENRCSDGSGAQVVSLHTKDFISTRPGVARFEIDPGWDMLHGDVIEVTTGDTLKCVNTGAPKLEAALDFSNPNDVGFAGAFVTEGTHFVIAVLESYAWEQLAPPKLIKLPIRVIPLHMKAAAVL